MSSKVEKYHKKIANYFYEKKYFTESSVEQLYHYTHFPFSARLVRLRTLGEMAYQRIKSKEWDKVEDLFTELDFIEAKVEGGQIYQLISEYYYALESLPYTSSRRQIVELLFEALKRDSYFINKHVLEYPQSVFQCLFNSCYLHDYPTIYKKYQAKESFRETGISLLMYRWLIEKQAIFPGFNWIRALEPPINRLGSSELAVFIGHIMRITAVGYSQCGNYIISISMDGTIRIWDIISCKLYKCINGECKGLTALHVCRDGSRIITGSTEGTVKIWDIYREKEVRSFINNNEEITHINLSFDDKLLLSLSKGGTRATPHSLVCVSNYNTGVVIEMYKVDDDFVIVDFIPMSYDLLIISKNRIRLKKWAGSSYASEDIIIYNITGYSDEIKIYIQSTQKIVITHSNCYSESDNIEALTFKGESIIDGIMINNFSITCGVDMDRAGLLIGVEPKELSLALSFPGMDVGGVTKTGHHAIQLWDIEDNKILSEYIGHSATIQGIVLSPDKYSFASFSEDLSIRVWNIRNKYSAFTIPCLFYPFEIIKEYKCDSSKITVTVERENPLSLYKSYETDNNKSYEVSCDERIIEYQIDDYLNQENQKSQMVKPNDARSLYANNHLDDLLINCENKILYYPNPLYLQCVYDSMIIGFCNKFIHILKVG